MRLHVLVGAGILVVGMASSPAPGAGLARFPRSEYRVVGLTSGELAVVHSAVRHSLRDPGSARFIAALATSGPEPGKFVCGFVNAKNGFGGYSGPQVFFGHFVAPARFQVQSFGGNTFNDRLTYALCSAHGLDQNSN